jgi:hypothetical protein
LGVPPVIEISRQPDHTLTFRDQGVWPGADEVEDDEALFSISELMILLITNSC